MGRVTARRPVVRLVDGRAIERPDTLAVEEPLQIRVGPAVVTTTMRTPGDDFDLIAGWLVAEGIVTAAADVVAMRIIIGRSRTPPHLFRDDAGRPSK